MAKRGATALWDTQRWLLLPRTAAHQPEKSQLHRLSITVKIANNYMSKVEFGECKYPVWTTQ